MATITNTGTLGLDTTLNEIKPRGMSREERKIQQVIASIERMEKRRRTRGSSVQSAIISGAGRRRGSGGSVRGGRGSKRTCAFCFELVTSD